MNLRMNEIKHGYGLPYGLTVTQFLIIDFDMVSIWF